MKRKKRKSFKSKLYEAVRVLFDYGFISEFEKDSFHMRFGKIKKK